MYACAECGRLACDTDDAASYPGNCPTIDQDEGELLAHYRRRR